MVTRYQSLTHIHKEIKNIKLKSLGKNTQI